MNESYLILWFSARPHDAPEVPPVPARVLPELPEIGDDVCSHSVLVIDIGSGAPIDPARLRQIERLAEAQRRAEGIRAIKAMVIVGDVQRLSSPEHLVWLRPDAVWPALPTGEAAERALDAIRAIADRRSHMQDARQRVANVLDALGYAYFVTRLDGFPVVTSALDRELLDDPPSTRSREQDWANVGARAEWLRKLESAPSNEITEYPALLRTHLGKLKWVDVDARLVFGAEGKPEAVEGIYRDATRRNLADQMSRALSTVGASDAGLKRTAAIICEAVALLFDARACAILLRDSQQGRVFPVHVWHDMVSQGERSCTEGVDNLGDKSASRLVDGQIFREEGIPWPAGASTSLHAYEMEGGVLDVSLSIFGSWARDAKTLVVLPLLQGELDQGDAPPVKEDPVRGYLAIPLVSSAFLERGGLQAELEGLLRLCTRQIELAASRDAFDLVREMLKARSSIADLKELDRTLDLARKALQARIPMEGCSIFRTGIEERQAILQIATTSGIDGSAEEACYAIGENNGLTARVAHTRRPLLSFDKTKEPGHAGKHLEKMPHPGFTWMGVPFLDRTGKPLGVIRCVNRLTQAERPAVTGFSFLDLRIVETFAHACAILTELALMQEERGRTLSRITHEIRTPAVGIQNNVRFLARAYLPPDNKVARVLSDLDLDASVLLNLLQQVDLLRGRAVSLQREPRVLTNIANIVRKTYFQLVPELRARGFDPERVEIDLYSLPMLWLPRAAFAQIAFNIFMNSIKYSHADPSRFSIKVEVERTTGAQPFRIHFKDTGIGVAEAQRTRIFEEGYRAAEARRHDARGLGLGLTISRKLIQQIAGELVLVSGTRGADFMLTLSRDLVRKPKGTS